MWFISKQHLVLKLQCSELLPSATMQNLENLNKPLLHIFNLSLQTAIFPNKVKIARVTPIFKEGENYELGNYRLISVLPCFSKIVEKSYI